MFCTIPLEIVSIQQDGFHLIFHATLGGEQLTMLLDTGASRTVFDEEKVKHLFNLSDDELTENQGPSGGIGTDSLRSSIAVIPEFCIGEAVFKDYHAALINLNQVNSLFTSIGLPPVEGILGGDLLEQTKAVIDYGKKSLKMKIRKCNQR